MRRYLVPLLLGVAGTFVLASLGVWQLQRLEWKESVLAEIEGRIGAAPVAIPETPDPEADRYLPVTVAGTRGPDALFALVSTKGQGAGYRVISTIETVSGRRILLDEGFLPVANVETGAQLPVTELDIVGNLHWPDEVDGFTPEPDLEAGLVFARDVPMLSRALETEPVLVVAREVSGSDLGALPLPVTTEGIPNNHLGYAVQWFGLALVWAGMTAFLIWRIQRRKV